jgi:hypothetical protein
MSDFLETNGTRPRSASWLLAIGLVALMGSAAPALGGETVVVTASAVDPPLLRTRTGVRVDFENRTGRAIHLEFEGGRGEHDVVQLPATGPFWVVFHRPGTHRYVVHVYEAKERGLAGVVEAADDAKPAGEVPSCDLAVMGVCVEK